jgi:DNA repair protein RecN (Recombination protein N)
MLQELAVSGLGVIERAEIGFEDGCNALTGETGAGKTLVVAALSLLLGGRADRSLVRAGHDEARVEAHFSLPSSHPAIAMLQVSGLLDDSTDEADLVISRTVKADGGSKVRVNGRLATVTMLDEIGSTLVEIAGQHEHHRIGSSRFARGLLDSFAGQEAMQLSQEVRRAVREAELLAAEAGQLADAARTRSRELDIARYEVQEISAARLSPGESERLRIDASRLAHAQQLAAGLEEAANELAGEGGVGDALAGATRELGALADLDPSLTPLIDRLHATAYEVADVSSEMKALLVAPDPDALQATRERLDEIAALTRKYGENEGDVLEYLDRATERQTGLEQADDRLEELTGRHRDALDHAHDLAARLRGIRTGNAKLLSEQVTSSLHELALDEARFEVSVTERDLYEGGTEEVTLLVAANAGDKLRPVAKVTSGGELSRIALALHLIVRSETVTTMVFDEVDAGVGGRSAQTVGRRLAELARSGTQVILVTHLPQVAAFADTHHLVSKQAGSEGTSSSVATIEAAERIEELSRMLAGLPESSRAQEHARELLEMAGETAIA